MIKSNNISRSALQASLIMLLLLSGCGSRESAVPFLKHWIIDPDPNTGTECCTDILMLGDINGDGNLDVAIGGQEAQSGGLVWYQYPSWEKHSIASGEFTTDGQLADLNGDGKTDVVIGTLQESKGEILWFENAYDAANGIWIRHPVGTGYAHDLVVGDVNADGKIDIVTCDKKKVVLWEQVSLEIWLAHTVIERAGEGIALADIDRDGDLDIIYGATWLENPGSLTSGPWENHAVAPKWPADTRVLVDDMNKDGRLDIVLTVSEGKGSVSWFESPENPRTGIWPEHTIEKGTLHGAHSLQVTDLDGDGGLDVVTAEMHTSWSKRVIVYFNAGGAFTPAVLAHTGSHNMRAGDIGGDGDIDIIGKNYGGRGRVVEMWENITSNRMKWEYVSVDQERPKDQRGKMGLVFNDVDGDGFTDILTGSLVYLNPSGNMSRPWKRYELPDDGFDVLFSLEVNGNRFCDLVGINGNTVQWIESADDRLDSWEVLPVGTVADGRTQGAIQAEILPGPKPQLVFTRGTNLYVMEIPADPRKDSWPLHLISTENAEEGVAAGDIDRDGDLDLAAVHRDGHRVAWFENPGSLDVRWQMHVVGEQPDSSQSWLDRIALADLDGDGKLDIIASEERQDGKTAAHLLWYEAPGDPKKGEWERRTIARYRSLNSMDVADFDGDGRVDIVVAEHTDQKSEGAQDNLVVVHLNRDGGRRWIPQVIERGPHSSHLGAKCADLDKDGGMELVSIGWGQYQSVHLWKRGAPSFGGASGTR